MSADQQYPMFIPPSGLWQRDRTTWGKQEADRYFAWLMSCKDQRVRSMLGFLGMSEAGACDSCGHLLAVGRAALSQFRNQKFATTDGGVGYLTNTGYALAADLGLLLADHLIRKGGDRIKWKIRRGGKTHISYNMPVLIGFGPGEPSTVDPILASIGLAGSVVSGRRDERAWVEAFESLVPRIPVI
ncbi:MAG: hypothetical protein MEQ07_06645 [Aquimonas sp.]|nr:hypothetical protein [Aquimonas sp.]